MRQTFWQGDVVHIKKQVLLKFVRMAVSTCSEPGTQRVRPSGVSNEAFCTTSIKPVFWCPHLMTSSSFLHRPWQLREERGRSSFWATVESWCRNMPASSQAELPFMGSKNAYCEGIETYSCWKSLQKYWAFNWFWKFYGCSGFTSIDLI